MGSNLSACCAICQCQEFVESPQKYVRSKSNTAQFPLVVCVVQKFLKLEGIIKYEEAKKIPGLLVELPFISADIIFCSHKWRSRMHPDDRQKTKFNQMKKLLTRKALRSVQYVWLDYLCVPQEDDTLKQQAIDSFYLYVRCCKYFVMLVGNCGDSTLLEYNKRGWCRLERFAALSPVNFMNLKIYVHNANTDTFIEASRVPGAIPSDADELNPIQGDFTGDKSTEVLRIAPALLDLCQEILSHPRDDVDEMFAIYIKDKTEIFMHNQQVSKARFLEGYVLYEQGRFEEAIVAYEDVLQFNCSNADAEFNLGVLFQETGELAKAIDHFHQTIILDPCQSLAHYNLGYIYAAQGNADQALQHFKLAANMNPRDGDTLISLGNVYREVGNVEAAVHSYLQAINCDANSAMACYNLAHIFHGNKNFLEAIEYYNRTMQLDPNHADALFNLGVCYQESGQSQQALDCYNKGSKLHPHNIGFKNAAQQLRSFATLAKVKR